MKKKVSKTTPISMYTDGSFHPNTKNGGYAAIIPETNEVVCGNAKNTTNNKMELAAVIRGLHHLPDNSSVTVHTDSRYVVDAFNKSWISNWKRNGWKTASGQPVKNKEDWENLIEEKSRHKKVKFVWVKGHNGDPVNEATDHLANFIAEYKN